MRIDLIVGARPNFVKASAILNSCSEEQGLNWRLIHTGQHYDASMSKNFFKELGIRTPDVNLEVGSASQAEQTGKIMTRYEKLLMQSPSDFCLVVGDVNSTMACAIVAKKMALLVGHVEGGLRSKDRGMPEEINRIVTDSITDYFFTTSINANDNLVNEGIDESRLVFVGNTMIDTLIENIERLRKPLIFDQHNLKPKNYIVLTLHRPNNVDAPKQLLRSLRLISELADDKFVIFPVHPRTMKVINKSTINPNIILTEPLSYLEFNYLVKYAFAVVTDSGGVSEETTYLNVPCITMRTQTERPETVEVGTNRLVGGDPEAIREAFISLNQGDWKKGRIPEKWDGKAGSRIVSFLKTLG